MGTPKSSMYIFVFRMASLPSGLVGACKPGVTTFVRPPFVRISGNSEHVTRHLFQRSSSCPSHPLRKFRDADRAARAPRHRHEGAAHGIDDVIRTPWRVID